MPPRREPGKSTAKGSKIPKFGNAPKDPPDEDSGDVSFDGNDRDGADVTQSSALDKILARFDKMDLEIISVKDTVDEGIKAQEFNAKQMEDKLQDHVTACKITKQEVKSLGEETDGLRARVNYQGFRLSDVEKKIEQLERERRKNIMIIEGVVENEEIPSPEIVDSLFEDLNLNFDSHVCDRVYRRGKAPQGPSAATAFTADRTGNDKRMHGDKQQRPRPIVVGFMRPTEKGKVFANLSKLKGNEKWNKVYFSDDYTDCQKNQIRDLRALAAYARRVGRVATVRNHHIWVDGKRFVYEEIGKLAPELTLEKAKTIEVLNGEGIAFQSVHSPLSNLYPSNVYHRDQNFLTSEAALHHTRAVICRRLKEAQDILETRDPYKVKDIGGSFKPTREWEEIEDSEIEGILLDKFTRNHYCRDFLLATGNKKLFEATGDRKWACGIPLSKIDTLTDKPPGENRMGKKLEVIRDKIRKILKGN